VREVVVHLTPSKRIRLQKLADQIRNAIALILELQSQLRELEHKFEEHLATRKDLQPVGLSGLADNLEAIEARLSEVYDYFADLLEREEK